MGKNKKHKQGKENYIQDSTDIYGWLLSLYAGVFTYNNMPLTVDTEYLEGSLGGGTRLVFYQDEKLSTEEQKTFLTLPFVGEGNINLYGKFIGGTARGGVGYVYENLIVDRVNPKRNAVLLKDNLLDVDPSGRLINFAEYLYNIERSIIMNVEQQRFPYFVQTNEKTALTSQAVTKDIANFENFIYNDKKFDQNSIKVFNTNVPYVADKLQELKKQIKNEIMSFIGVPNNGAEKNERLVKDEVIVSNGEAIAYQQLRFQSRKRAIDEINELFGLDITVLISNDAFTSLENEVDDFVNDLGEETEPTEDIEEVEVE